MGSRTRDNVRDLATTHHYRFQIVDNTAPVLQFHYDAID